MEKSPQLVVARKGGFKLKRKAIHPSIYLAKNLIGSSIALHIGERCFFFSLGFHAAVRIDKGGKKDQPSKRATIGCLFVKKERRKVLCMFERLYFQKRFYLACFSTE